MNKAVITCLGILFLLGCKKGGDLFENPPSKRTGITFSNTISETDELNILDYLYFYNGGGVAVGDINNDSLVDVFFSGNQVKNKLYLNKGGLKFEDISQYAGIEGKSSWNTGVSMADINGDGLLDIYVCAVVGINGFNGHNELFINQGDNTFKEESAKYGLDFDSYSSSATFFDYDLDGDLDCYLLNHAVHTSESYGPVDLRRQRNYETGDKLLRNDDGKFVDVSKEAGIYGGINGYGLGIAVSDFNMDGYPDIYVGNDFHEDDYYYLNNADGTFTESLKEYFGHTSRFSMGNDVADINHDGLPDLISLDMLPDKEVPLKSSEGDDNVEIQRLRVERFGYHYQFTRNMMYVNQPDGNFMETALMSGIAATDWSWSTIFGDYNHDGYQDLFVANGIPRRPNDLDFIKFVSSDQIANKINNTKLVDKQALDMMPSGNVHNYVFKGQEELQFEDMSGKWISNDTVMSGAMAYGDFDNDGDLDIVTNNLNQEATLYINKINSRANHIKLKFNYKNRNKFGTGTKVFAFSKGKQQFKELFPSRGFQASSEPIAHFGLGEISTIDSLKIIWPDKTYQVIKHVETNQTLTISPKNNKPYNYSKDGKTITPLFKKLKDNLGIDFVHHEDNYVDFNREKLIPYKVSDRGPALAIGDLNSDGNDDIFFGGSKYFPSKTFLFQDSLFVPQTIQNVKNDSIKEDVAAVLADFDGDERDDLLVGSAGGDFFGKSEQLMDSYFIQKDTAYVKHPLPNSFENASVLSPNDFDQDGDLDVFVGNHTITGKFGQPAQSFLLENVNGYFEIVKGFNRDLGMVTDAVWSDFNGDGADDLIVVGEWMAPKFLKNERGRFIETNIQNSTGLWQSIHPFDIDADGDTDYLLGNWGLNSKFKASEAHPLKLYFNDFDGNGQTETVIAIFKEDNYYPLETLDGLSSQMVSLRKKFTTYKSFAGKTIEDIFDKEILNTSKILEVNTLESGYLKNNKGAFEFVAFKPVLQVSPLMDFATYDFDGDKKSEVLAGGNYFGVKPYHGRFDSFSGALINNENDIILGGHLGLDFTQKSIRHLEILTVDETPYLMVVNNNDQVDIYTINKSKDRK
ncbi:VCBS repeat-containing protein [Allomuricauda sp. d1]|uniref:VCBS repeat-containing protein n=1 Tax=Allomuricauda sp. d1 TaxID=3136725 RepID=UPI0031D26B95